MIWFCPNCETKVRNIEDDVPMHICRFGLMAPLTPTVNVEISHSDAPAAAPA